MGLLQVREAVDKGLGRILAECLIRPGSELAQIAIDAKLVPLSEAIAVRLAKFGDVAASRAALVPAFIGWHAAVREFPTYAPQVGVWSLTRSGGYSVSYSEITSPIRR